MKLIALALVLALLLGCASPPPQEVSKNDSPAPGPPDSPSPEPQTPPDIQEPVEAPVPGPAPEPAPSDKTCSDGGVTVHEMESGRRIAPAYGDSVKCEGAFAIEKEGKRYFGCPEGKIILDCDWFVQNIGAENTTADVEFGSNSVADFRVPEVPGTCESGELDEGMLATPGKACDLQTVAQVVNAQRLG